MRTKLLVAAGIMLAAFVGHADVVTDWNQIMLRAEHIANVSPLVSGRVGAIVQAAVFDAVNGIERRYEPIYVPADAPRGASRQAAAAEAAYTALVALFPDQKTDFDSTLAASLAHLVEDGEDSGNKSLSRGIAWGRSVAEAILAGRSTDGFERSLPAFEGGTAVGEWRPTPPDFSPFAGLKFATMTPWVMMSPSQFRPPGPPSLRSDLYTADFTESKTMGGVSSTLRTADETLGAQFWDSANGTYFWNSLAVRLSLQQHLSLSQNARLLAALNLAMADARIACWDAKFTYLFWRPITAITLADTDGNPDTTLDPTWFPMLGGTPPHPDYPSGHSTESGAAATVLAHFFGEDTQFFLDSDWMPGVTRSFSSFSAALEDVKNARIFGGIHFRTACNDGQQLGRNVANYILENAVRPKRSHSPAD